MHAQKKFKVSKFSNEFKNFQKNFLKKSKYPKKAEKVQKA